MSSYRLESVRRQYEKYPYPAYDWSDVRAASNWLREREIRANEVVDIGCGTGLWSIAFATSGSSVTAVDFSKASLTQAEKMARQFGVGIELHHADLFGFETSRRYGLVFCNGVLHHTANARAGFHKIAGLVKDGGVLVTSFYNRLSPFRLAKLVARGFGGENIETRKLVAKQLVGFPLCKALLTFAGRSQIGPISSTRDYVSKEENVVDLLCHAHTSYHTLWEVTHWHQEEGFKLITTYPSSSHLTAILPNLIFFVGRKPLSPSE